MPIGTAIAVATAVIISVATKKGIMPKVGGSETGYHLVPKKNSRGEVCRKMGKPSRNKRMSTPNSTTIAKRPLKKIQSSIDLSPNRRRCLRLVFRSALFVRVEVL